MKSLLLTILTASALIYFQPTCRAQSLESAGDDADVRENPVIDGIDEEFDLTVPSFINQSKNVITLNGANWAPLKRAIALSETVPFSIVHIGDSHLQADFATGAVRDYLQYDHGNAGRGLITPLKMSGTNQPQDYSFSGDGSWNSVKLMGNNWKRTMGFTGTSITPTKNISSFTVSTSERDDYDPFTSITIFHKGQFFVTSIEGINGQKIPFISRPSKDYTHIQLTREVTSAKINFESAGDLTLFGVSLSGNRPGIFYHTIGNNGATYDTYNRIGNVGEGISPLSPNLVIISLGTNEAFGRLSTTMLRKAIDRLVQNIRKDNPSAEILLVTPMECQRSTYTTVTKKSKKKSRRRRATTQKVKGYKVNDNIAPIRQTILEYGKENHIAVYDWYEVAGGKDASSKWISDGLYSHDRVHHSYKGYNLQGFLLYQALKNALE